MKPVAVIAAAIAAFAAERYIAIDNVCAWPNVKLLADGTLVAVIFNQPGHGGMEGDVEAWASRDGGKIWKLAGTPAPHRPGTLRLNHAAGLAHDGSLVVLASGRVLEKRNDIWLPVVVARSTDAGKTWTRSEQVTLPSGIDYLIPFGDIVQLSGRRLAASFYHDRRFRAAGSTSEAPLGSRRGSAYVLFSEDDGLSWGNGVLLGKDDYNETTLLRLGPNRMLAAARTYGDAHLDLLVSEDEGRTWTNRGPVSMPAQHPANLLRLNDGRILLTYGIRERGNRAVAVRVSSDEGRTWGAPWPIATFAGSKDHGYPSAVQLADGTIVTAWYTSAIEGHQRYHMGVLRWKLD